MRTGGLADDGVVEHYAYGLRPGDVGVGNIIRDASPTILTLNSNRFDRASEGFLKLYVNDTLIETMDLTAAGELIIFYDTGAESPALSTNPAESLVTAPEPGSPVNLSGVKYMPSGAAVHIKVTATGVFVNTFHAQPVTLNGGEAGFADQDIDFVAGGSGELSGYSDPPTSAIDQLRGASKEAPRAVFAGCGLFQGICVVRQKGLDSADTRSNLPVSLIQGVIQGIPTTSKQGAIHERNAEQAEADRRPGADHRRPAQKRPRAHYRQGAPGLDD